MSRLNSKTSSLTQGNVNTHIFTEFSNNATEDTQKQVLQAITNLGTGGEAVSDQITHTKLDVLNTTVLNQIIKGKDLGNENPIEITADSISTGGTEADIINRLYTHSSLYGNSVDGFGVKTDVALSCDNTGKLNVNVVGGDAFDGVIKGIIPAGGASVSFSADSFTPPSGNPINKLYTRSSLYGSAYSEEEIIENPVQVSDSGEIFVKSLTPFQTEVSNNVIVSPIVEKQSFDVVLNANLYADSTGDNTPPFQRDPLGHQGWYYINTNPAKASNVYYYLNIPPLILTKQSDVLLENINFFYAVITIDYVGSLSSNLPYLVMGSQPLGNETDITPNFMNTRYAYTLPVGITYITGEPILIYWSDSENKKPLETFMPNLRRIKLNDPIITGTGESPTLGFFSINTSTEVAEKQEYTLIGAGYKFNSAQGEQGGVLNDATFDFLFTAKTPIENNLAKLTFNENNELKVINTITTTNTGSFGNVASNITLTTGQDTSVFSTDDLYKKDCILSVRDTSITSTGYYSISVSSDSGQNYEPLGIVQPLVSLSGIRGGSTTLNLSPYNRIKLINESVGTYDNVYISLYSS
jgi:hypothetical protein